MQINEKLPKKHNLTLHEIKQLKKHFKEKKFYALPLLNNKLTENYVYTIFMTEKLKQYALNPDHALHDAKALLINKAFAYILHYGIMKSAIIKSAIVGNFVIEKTQS